MHCSSLQYRSATFIVALSFSTACSLSPEARSAKQARSRSQELQQRLEQLSKKAVGCKSDDASVRACIDTMSRSVVESLIPASGYRDFDVNRPAPITCRLDDIYGPSSDCARSFVKFLGAYYLSYGRGSSGYAAPEWAHGGETIIVTYDSHFYELEFNAEALKLTTVRYLAQEK